LQTTYLFPDFYETAVYKCFLVERIEFAWKHEVLPD
jgi:hypothetical protein